jgi:hypothetical protein
MHSGKSPGAPKGQRNGRYRHGRWTIERQTLLAEARNLRKAVDASLKRVLGPSREGQNAGRSVFYPSAVAYAPKADLCERPQVSAIARSGSLA